jgi:hypothetical protein
LPLWECGAVAFGASSHLPVLLLPLSRQLDVRAGGHISRGA